MTNEELLAGLDEMIKDAPGIGLCTMPFKMIRDAVADLIRERDNAISHLKDALSQRDRWISVEDHLPDPGTEVMVAFDDGETWCLWQNWKECDGENNDPLVYMIDPVEATIHRVTHWMPKPVAPVSKK